MRISSLAPTSKSLLTLCFAFLASLLSTSVSAQKHDELTMNGIASFWLLNTEIYAAALYLESPKDTVEAILYAPGHKRMEMRIVAEKWRKRNFAKTWRQAIIINNDKETQQALLKEITAFTQIAKGPLLYGDKITIDYTPSQGTVVKINDTEMLTVKNELFFNALVRTWIGPRPPTSDFKNYILKLDSSDLVTNDLLGFYDYIRPNMEGKRFKETAAWKSSKKKI